MRGREHDMKKPLLIILSTFLCIALLLSCATAYCGAPVNTKNLKEASSAADEILNDPLLQNYGSIQIKQIYQAQKDAVEKSIDLVKLNQYGDAALLDIVLLIKKMLQTTASNNPDSRKFMPMTPA